MKIQHYAIIFLIIMIPFSIVCRNVINKKILNLRDETRYNNIIDNATFDAVSIIHDVAGLEDANNIIFGKNVPITRSVAEEAINTFFNTLCVDFNLPMSRKIGESYFDRYIPAILIVGYDGLYVYSVEKKGDSYSFQLKPKIPYSASYDLGDYTAIFNYTLDNYVRIYFVDSSGLEGAEFGKGYYPDRPGNFIREIRGYVGTPLDNNYDHIDDFTQYKDPDYEYIINPHYLDNNYGSYNGYNGVRDYLSTIIANNDANATKQSDLNKGSLSYFMFEWARQEGFSNSSIPYKLGFLFSDRATRDNTEGLHHSIQWHYVDKAIDYTQIPTINFGNATSIVADPERFEELFDFTEVNRDYSFDENKHIIGEASAFHQMRRHAIISTITDVMKEEFNEHNEYAKLLGVTYDFNVPAITNDQWNNTIDDVSVLAFMQGMPMGGDMYYNNYSLGGARIVQASNIFCEIVRTIGNEPENNPYYNGYTYHRVFHKSSCPCLTRDKQADPVYADNAASIKAVYNKNADGLYYDYDDLFKTDREFYNQVYQKISDIDGLGPVEQGIFPDNITPYNSSGIVREELFEEAAIELGFSPCSICM